MPKGYGYVQFHLYKSASYTKAGNELDYLHEAAKVKVTLRTESEDILTPTVTVEVCDKSLAELGVQTDKFQLMAGEYTLLSYQVLDALDNPVFNGTPGEDMVFSVKPGCLVSEDLLVSVVERGKVNFTLTKVDPLSRAGGADGHPFYRITSVDVTVRNSVSHENVTIKNLKTEHEFVYSDDSKDYVTAVCKTDSLVSMKGGMWEVTSFTTYFDKSRKVYETCDKVTENSFEVRDNEVTEAKVPVKLDLTSDYLQDALAIRAIWEALDGPNWRVKWDFDCDVDIWTAQEGIQIHENGRVASLDLTNTGAKGDMPAALGQLTELRVLSLGNQTFDESSSVTPAGTRFNSFEAGRKDIGKEFTETYLRNGDRLHCFSDEMRLAFELSGVTLHESDKPLRSFPTLSPDINYATSVTSLPKEINNLKNLQQLSVGYGPMKSVPEDLSGLESLTDLDFFYLPELTEFPMGLATLPSLQVMIFACNYSIDDEGMYKGIQALASGAAGASLQAIYFPMQRIAKVPDMSAMSRLALLNVQSCGVREFEAPFGKKHCFTTFAADHNELSSLPLDSEGYFIGVDNNTEAVDFSYNKFTSLPDMLDASSIYTFGTFDFSNNQISSFDRFGEEWRGMNCSILNLSYNKLKEFPVEISRSGSSLSYIQFQGNGMERVPEEALEGDNLYSIVSIDLSRNKLKDLPDNFSSRTFSYLNGLDLSYNRFSSFPYLAVNNQNLRVFIFTNQRDANGNRCMREWPNGIGDALFGLRALYLGSNDIRVVNDELSYLIYNLDISDNPNISIDVSRLCPYIAAGAFRLIYSRGQDIRGCDDYLDL